MIVLVLEERRVLLWHDHVLMVSRVKPGAEGDRDVQYTDNTATRRYSAMDRVVTVSSAQL